VSLYYELQEKSITHTDSYKIYSIIANLDSKKSACLYGITVNVLKSINYAVIPILSDIINKSFQSGVFSQCLKNSESNSHTQRWKHY